MDRDAVSDALIDLERLTAKIANGYGMVNRLEAVALATQLANIHARIAKACGLEDPE